MKKMLRIMRNVSIGVGVFVLVVLVIAIIDISNDPDPAADDAEEIAQEEPELSPEEQRREFVEAQFSAWDGSHRELVKVVKDSMNDSGSFEHIETLYRDDGETIALSMTFRGANAFGGIVSQTVEAVADPETGEILAIDIAD